MTIRGYREKDREIVVRLWSTVFRYPAAHNSPETSIDLKISAHDGLFFVAADGKDSVTGTVLAGWDGHRGWIYSLAVFPEYRGNGIGRTLLNHAVETLKTRGCLKVNLQILPDNPEVIRFYEEAGFRREERISMGRLLY